MPSARWGPGATSSAAPTRIANFETAFYQSNIADYASYEQWSLEGKLTAEQRAHRVWKKMLAEYEDPGIDPAQDEALLEFIARRKAVLTRHDRRRVSESPQLQITQRSRCGGCPASSSSSSRAAW